MSFILVADVGKLWICCSEDQTRAGLLTLRMARGEAGVGLYTHNFTWQSCLLISSRPHRLHITQGRLSGDHAIWWYPTTT